MKKLGFLAVIAIGFLFVACEKEEVVSEGTLPTAASNFIQTHFPDHDILQVKREKDFLGKTMFEVLLSNNYELEFKEKGDVQKVDGNGKQIPESVVTPSAILDHIEAQHPDQYVTSWEIDTDSKSEIEVEINNGLELRFDKEGKFLRYDD